MRIFTFHAGCIVEGSTLIQLPDGMPALLLGERGGRGRKYTIVPLDRRNPPDLYRCHNGKMTINVVREASARRVIPRDPDKPSFWVLEKPSRRDDPGILLRINTQACHRKNTFGNWEVLAGAPELLAVGQGAYNSPMDRANWQDGLLRIMLMRDVIRINPEGWSRPYVVSFDEGGIQCVPFQKYDFGR